MLATDERRRCGGAAVLLFTDLDGTLLDSEDYSFDESIDAVRSLQVQGVPIIFCSSKTRAEQETYRDMIGVRDPFIVEDGSALFVPEGYFSERPAGSTSRDGYHVVELGTGYDEVRRLAALLEKDLGARGYGSMSSAEVSELTGLSHQEAVLAKEREYSETVAIDEEHVHRAMELIKGRGFTATFGGKFHTIKGDTDKGRAVDAMVRLYVNDLGPVRSVGIGDSENDHPMLRAVDEAYLVTREGLGATPGECPCKPVRSFSEAAESVCWRLSSETDRDGGPRGTRTGIG